MRALLDRHPVTVAGMDRPDVSTASTRHWAGGSPMYPSAGPTTRALAKTAAFRLLRCRMSHLHTGLSADDLFELERGGRRTRCLLCPDPAHPGLNRVNAGRGERRDGAPLAR